MGEPISNLPPVELPLRQSDLIEISREIVGDPGRYESFKCTALAAFVGQATTTVQGIAELADNAETIEGLDGERVVTPQGLEAAIRHVLENRIVAGPGIVLDYDNGYLTISVE